MRGPKRREIGHGLLAERALLPVVPVPGGVPLHPAPGLRRALLQRLDLDGVGLRLHALADGGRRADQGAGGRHRHGPRLRRGQVRHPDRHPRGRGRLRRHGLQGGRDRRRRDRPAARHEDRRPAGRRAGQGAAARPRRPASPSSSVMADAIAEPRTEVAASAPKIVSMEIPIDKIGEVIGPKGKVINTLQQETGADIAVDDDGMVGTVTIGAKDGNAVEEARRRISLILDPPTAEVGAVYPGKVVNITKFGAFVNMLPGPRRPAPHLQALAPGRRQAGRSGRGRADPRPADRGAGGRHRPAGQGVPLPGRRARSPRPAPSSVAASSAIGIVWRRQRPPATRSRRLAATASPRRRRAPARRRSSRSRTPSRSRAGGRPRRPRPGRTDRRRREGRRRRRRSAPVPDRSRRR